MDFRPTPHERSSYSRGDEYTHLGLSGDAQREIPAPGASAAHPHRDRGLCCEVNDFGEIVSV